jgi:hypothetical protein
MILLTPSTTGKILMHRDRRRGNSGLVRGLVPLANRDGFSLAQPRKEVKLVVNRSPDISC